MTNIVRPENDAPVDHMKIHKDVVWVIRTLWGGAVAFVLAATWVIALAQDVKTNTEKVDESATKEQLSQVLSGIKDIKDTLERADTRQRTIQSQVDKLSTEVENLKEKVEE